MSRKQLKALLKFLGRIWFLAKRTMVEVKVDWQWRRGRLSSSGATNGTAECDASSEGRDRVIELICVTPRKINGERGGDREWPRKRGRTEKRDRKLEVQPLLCICREVHVHFQTVNSCMYSRIPTFHTKYSTTS